MELSDVSVFVKVIQEGSFSAAAKKLGAPKSTVSSKVSGLERRLGITLLQRTTRKLRLTDEGAAFFQTCARALAEIEAAEALAAHGQKNPQGRVSLTAPNDLGRLMARFLKVFIGKYPALRVDLLLTNRYVDLIGEGVDVAIRAGDLPDSSLLARKVATTKRALYASPTYLATAGSPCQPEDLSAHRCILFGATGSDRWLLTNGKKPTEVKISGAVTVDDLAALKELASQDLGITLVPHFMARDEVAAGRLVPVLPEWSSAPSGIYVVYAAQKFQHPKVKTFVDEIVPYLEGILDSV